MSNSTKVNVVIFSKDRAMQLDALIRSIEVYAPFLLPVRVVYKASTNDFLRGYQLIGEKGIVWFSEPSYDRGFDRAFKNALRSDSSLLMMLVDDDIFFRPMPEIKSVERGRAYAPRLGKNCTSCYPIDKPQKEGEYDFACTMSVDGHVYPAEDIMPWLLSRIFTDPNDIENQLYDKVFPVLDYAEHSCLVGIPHNRVGVLNTINRQGHGSPVEMNNLFLGGFQINFNAMDFSSVTACHQEIPFVFERR